MKVYDCFPFCWELDLLEIRLNTLNHLVDHFVIAESPWFRSGEPKPLHYEENKERFAAFEDKIIHIVEERPPDKDRKVMEWRQKNLVSVGIFKCDKDDLIFVSDADEIWKPEIFKLVVELTKSGPCYLNHRLHYYFFNNIITNGHKYSSNVAFCCRYRDFTNVKAMRRKWQSFKKINNSGWHYAYLMSPETIQEKIRALGVARYRAERFLDVNHIRMCMREPKDLYDREGLYKFEVVDPAIMDAPPYVMENLNKYDRFLYPGVLT